MSATHVLDDDVSPSRSGVRASVSPFRIEATQDLEAAEPAWNELEAAGSAFQSRAWLAPWYEFIAPSVRAEPLFVTVRDRATGRPLAFFPFCVRRRWGVKVVEFPDLGVTDYNAPIFAPGVEFSDEQLAALWAEVRLAVPGADLFLFDKVPEALYGRPLPFARLAWLRPMELRCWTIELPADREDYDKTVLRSKDRKEQRRKRRNLVEKLGEPTLVEATTREQAVEFFDTLKSMRAERFRRQGRRDIFREFAIRAVLSGRRAGRMAGFRQPGQYQGGRRADRRADGAAPCGQLCPDHAFLRRRSRTIVAGHRGA